MKLIIQVPCSNEADRLPAMLGDLPRAVPGADIPKLLGPILACDADMVVGTREGLRAYNRGAALHGVARFG
jgi:hypothetical protein